MLDEKKGTCCGKCGHVHVKGTSCPKPFLKGKNHCSRRVNEDVVSKFKKWAGNIDIRPRDIDYYAREYNLTPDQKYLLKKAFPPDDIHIRSTGPAPDDVRFRNDEMHTMDHDGPDEFHQVHADVEENYETENFCAACLAEYLLEYEHKLEEAEYRGRKVTLGKPFLTPGGPKKRSVYVKNAKGNVVKVNFGDPNMKIKKSNPARRRSFRARHKCSNPGPRWKARYWSCKAW